MKYSRLFTKTSKDALKDEPSLNAQLLIRAGFIDKTMAGVYAFLPLGNRVLNKIEDIVREEMIRIGSQELLMNTLQPKKFWTDTNRWENVDILFKLDSQTGSEYAIACSHEEQVTPMVKKMVSSWKDLPETEYGTDLFYKSYLMGVENVEITDLESLGLHVMGKTGSGSFKIFIPKEKLNVYKAFLDDKLGLGFWNEVVAGDEIIFFFKHKNGDFQELVLDSENANSVYELWQDFLGKKVDNLNPQEALDFILDDFKNNGADGFYKDFLNYKKTILPLSVFQIQTKFRDELRAKSGLLRGREFRMKDMYDFHQNEQSLDTYYEMVIKAYSAAYEKMGLEVYPTEASGGIFTTNPSHEFQAICSAGEDKIYKVPSTGVYYNEEMAPVKAPDFGDPNEPKKPREDIKAEGVIGVEALSKMFDIPEAKTTKTLFFEDIKTGQMIAAVVRGDYQLNEEKLAKVAGGHIRLASEGLVKKVTGAGIGYAGLIDLPSDVRVYIDESVEKLVNFEMGTNKDGYHSINVNFDVDFPRPEKFYDIKTIKEGDLFPETSEAYEVYISAEVGNIFKLGTKYTDAIDFKFVDKDNQLKPVIMGCHGIGTSRCMAVIAEVCNDDKGLVWPESVAPFKYHIVTVVGNKDSDETRESIMQLGSYLYEKLKSGETTLDFDKVEFVDGNYEKDEVFWDDREGLSFGAKLNDADLIGIPYQVIITKRGIENGQIEIKRRKDGEVRYLGV